MRGAQNMHGLLRADPGLKRVYPESNMSFDEKLDFSWHMKILGHFQCGQTLWR